MSLSTPSTVDDNCLPTTTQGKPQGTDPSLAYGTASATISETQRNFKVSEVGIHKRRATRIVGVQLVQVNGETLGENDVVVWWPEESRQNEARIIDLATEAGLIHPHLIDHHELDCNSCQIREDLGISQESLRGSLLHRRLLFEKLNPISSLRGEDFMTAWIQCYRCHFRLRLNGIEHGHITETNLMVNSIAGAGVFNDYDLPILKKKSEDGSIRDTAYIDAIPFMAFDLLTKDFFAGKIRRIYRHDVESFIWVLPWVLLRGKHSQAEELNRWTTSDFAGCRRLKLSFLLTYHEYRGYPEVNECPYKAACRLLRWLQNQARAVQDEADSASESGVDENIEPASQVRHRNDPSDQAAYLYFRQFEAELKRRWRYGFGPLPESRTVPLNDQEPFKLD